MLVFPYQFQTPPAQVVTDVAGKVILGHKQDQRTSLTEVPAALIDLVVQIEDRRFRSHP